MNEHNNVRPENGVIVFHWHQGHGGDATFIRRLTQRAVDLGARIYVPDEASVFKALGGPWEDGAGDECLAFFMPVQLVIGMEVLLRDFIEEEGCAESLRVWTYPDLRFI